MGRRIDDHFMQKNGQIEKHGIIVANTDEVFLGIAIHGRYTEQPLLGVPYGSLQGVTVRPVPCNYYVIQPVVALSRRKRGFKSRRGRQINNLQEKYLLSV